MFHPRRAFSYQGRNRKRGPTSVKLYHGSGTGGLQMLEPRLADHGRPYLYLTTNAVVAAFYTVKAIDPPHYWVPYGFDQNGSPVYHELYPHALLDVYSGKQGYLYHVEAVENRLVPLPEIPGAYTATIPLAVTGCEALSDVYAYLLCAEAEHGLRISRFYEKKQTELEQWYQQIGEEIQSLHLLQNPNCSYARFLRKKIPLAWEAARNIQVSSTSEGQTKGAPE